MKKYRFKTQIKNDLMEHILPSAIRSSGNLAGKLMEIQNAHGDDLDRLAKKIGFTYFPVPSSTSKVLLYPSDRQKGCCAKKYCSFAILIMYAMGPHFPFRHPIDMLDGNDQDRADLNSEFATLNTRRTPQTMGQICCDQSCELVISPTSDNREFKWIAENQTLLYKELAVSPAKYQEWYKANPSGFFVFYYEGDIIGHLTLLPFKEEAFLPYKQGLIKESDLGEADIWGVEERDKITSLYVESYMLASHHQDSVSIKIRENFMHMASIVADLDVVDKIYALNATIQGTNAIRSMGFKAIEFINGSQPNVQTMHEVSVKVLCEKIKGARARIASAETRGFLRRLDKIESSMNATNAIHDIHVKFTKTIEEVRKIARSTCPSKQILKCNLETLDLLLLNQGIDLQIFNFVEINRFLDGCI